MSIVETSLFLPSEDTNDSEPIETLSISNAGWVFFRTTCATSIAIAVVRPLALIVTLGFYFKYLTYNKIKIE